MHIKNGGNEVVVDVVDHGGAGGREVGRHGHPLVQPIDASHMTAIIKKAVKNYNGP